MKRWLILVLLAASPLAVVAQGKVMFANDSNHLYVLGTTLGADMELGGGSTSGTMGAIPAGPFPSGVTLVAALFGGTNSTSLTLQGTPVVLTGTGWLSAGRMGSRNIITTFPGGTPQYFRIIIWDNAYPTPDPNQPIPTIGGASYIGFTAVFTATPGTGITYPSIMPGGPAASTLPAQMNIVINAVDPSGLPLIHTQPQSQTVIVGSNATLTVSAGGGSALSYQWHKDDVPRSGATEPTLAFNGATLADNGVYKVVVSNAFGSITSAGAALQVLPYGAPSIRVNGQLAAGSVRATSPATISMTNGFPGGGFIFYTLNGSTPTTSSSLYFGPFTINNSLVVRAMCLTPDFSQSAEAPALSVELPPMYSLQVNVSGGGSVVVNPPGGSYMSNTVVSLNAVPATNWAFTHWTGDVVGNTNPASVTMNAARSVTAVFVPTAYPLTLSTPGGGTVTANGQTLAANTYFPAGSNVALAANPHPGWSFLRWQGTVTNTANPLNLAMNQTNVVEAIFGTSVQTNIGGQGSLLLNPANPVAFGTTVTATATAAPGSFFVTWSQAASGTNNPTSLVVTTASPTVGALFAAIPRPYLLAGYFTSYAGVTIQGVPGRTYAIEYSTNLFPPGPWMLLTNLTLSSSEQTWVDTSASLRVNGAMRRFYRAWTQ